MWHRRLSDVDREVRAGEEGHRDFDTERFRRLEINDKQEFGGLLNRKFGVWRLSEFDRHSERQVELRRESPAR